MKTLKQALAAALTSLAVCGPASAGIFTYDIYLSKGLGNATLEIDSTAATATYTGANIDLTVTSSDLLGFSGADPTTTVFEADDIAGTLVSNGTTYNAVLTPRRSTLFRFDSNRAGVWTQLVDSAGATRGFDFGGRTTFTGVTTTPPIFAEPPSGPTPPGSSSGGGSVPVPATALFILAGFAGIGGAMRRKKKAL